MAQLKRKVTLRQKNASNSEPTSKSSSPTPKKPWWPWALGAVVVCGGLFFLLTRGNNTTGNEKVQSTAQVTKTVFSQDNPATVEPFVSDTAATAEEKQSAQKETPQASTSQKVPEKPAQRAESTSLKSNSSNNAVTPRSVLSTTANGTVEEEAWRTIRGSYGNGFERKEALGSRYDEIQAKVNEFYREGKVY